MKSKTDELCIPIENSVKLKYVIQETIRLSLELHMMNHSQFQEIANTLVEQMSSDMLNQLAEAARSFYEILNNEALNRAPQIKRSCS